MQKLKSWELLLIALTLVFAAFLTGYFVGQRSVGSVSISGTAAVVETEKQDIPPETSGSEGRNLPSTAAPGNSDKVNINSATVEELTALPGIGEALARRIVDYREEHGPFGAKDELMDVSGIGEGKYEACKDKITVE